MELLTCTLQTPWNRIVPEVSTREVRLQAGNRPIPPRRREFDWNALVAPVVITPSLTSGAATGTAVALAALRLRAAVGLNRPGTRNLNPEGNLNVPHSLPLLHERRPLASLHSPFSVPQTPPHLTTRKSVTAETNVNRDITTYWH